MNIRTIDKYTHKKGLLWTVGAKETRKILVKGRVDAESSGKKYKNRKKNCKDRRRRLGWKFNRGGTPRGKHQKRRTSIAKGKNRSTEAEAGF